MYTEDIVVCSSHNCTNKIVNTVTYKSRLTMKQKRISFKLIGTSIELGSFYCFTLTDREIRLMQTERKLKSIRCCLPWINILILNTYIMIFFSRWYIHILVMVGDVKGLNFELNTFEIHVVKKMKTVRAI